MPTGGIVMNEMGEMVERRLFPRVTVQGDGQYRRIPINRERDRVQNARILDVSHGGFRLHSDKLLNLKSNLLLDLQFPGSPHFRALATVAWVKAMPGSDGYEVGGTFVEPTDEARAALGNIILRH
jgi:hypothetical protein